MTTWLRGADLHRCHVGTERCGADGVSTNALGPSASREQDSSWLDALALRLRLDHPARDR